MSAETSTTQMTDLYRERAPFFRAPRRAELVDLPEASYLVVDGEGAPESPASQDAIAALYSVAYTLKAAGKREGRDFRVPTFEGAWWIQSEEGELPRSAWRWRLSMMVPDFVSGADVGQALNELAAKKKAPEAEVHFERSRRGLCVQVLHVGPYEAENESIERMNALMAQQGLTPRGPHHEVYLGDPRRSKPETLKTILRQPVQWI